ncbi:DUF4376 domain-containing protein [Solidesulfovibrio sp.]
MQDFCFKANAEAPIVAALQIAGLTTADETGNPRPVGDYCFAGQIVETPGQYDPDTLAEISPPAYLPGVYAAYRATDTQAAAILALEMPEGVALVDPPAGLPLWGGEWLGGPSLAEAQTTAVARLQVEKWARMMGKFRDSAGHLYDVDAASRALLNGKITTINSGKPLPPGFVWKTAEKDAAGQTIYAPHTAESLIALAFEIEDWTEAIFRASEKAQGTVMAAGTLKAVSAAEAGVVWP